MNFIWSKFVQGTNTLYSTRKLRFDDMFAAQYQSLFALDRNKALKILEIGCGPGALAGALHRWYPNAQITAIDRDSELIKFAKAHESGIDFLEGDATALPFADNQFDVAISNTVSEHIEPSLFYGEQLRVLKPEGVCLVLSSRKGVTVNPSCLAFNKFEQKFWKKVDAYDNSLEEYAVCRYPMTEAELPLAMEQYGFKNVQTGYATVDLTPDNPKYSDEMARRMVEATRLTTLDAIEMVLNTMPKHFSVGEVEEMKRLANAKYDKRLEQYDNGEKQWDTNVSVILVIRGVK
jgi:ubiquinone/menaquinone biosynthesis C-methylase UbiE